MRPRTALHSAELAPDKTRKARKLATPPATATPSINPAPLTSGTDMRWPIAVKHHTNRNPDQELSPHYKPQAADTGDDHTYDPPGSWLAADPDRQHRKHQASAVREHVCGFGEQGHGMGQQPSDRALQARECRQYAQSPPETTFTGVLEMMVVVTFVAVPRMGMTRMVMSQAFGR